MQFLTTLSSSKYVCEFCGFMGKNQQSKSAHMRGCSENKNMKTSKKGAPSSTMCVETE